jgi:pyruvate kinase
MSTELLCTVGPSSMRPGVIERLEGLGVGLLRINLSHTKLEDLPGTIREMQERTQVPICLDTEGAQVRTGDLESAWVEIPENSTPVAVARAIRGNVEAFAFYPPEVTEQLRVGDLISIDFNALLVQVVGRQPGLAKLRVLNGGCMGRNRAVTMLREFPLPPLTEKDRQALRIGAEMGIRHVALSFASCAKDVDEIRRVFGQLAFVISKIESIQGLRHLHEIARRSEAILIDRGDLSREVPIERIPATQKAIIKVVKSLNKKVYVATNLLESMTASPLPTRAEVNDVHSTLSDGVDGLVLAAETAVGKYPLACAQMICRIIHEFENPVESESLANLRAEPLSLLVRPHGGSLVHQEADDGQRAAAVSLPRLEVSDEDLMDCEQIALGTYSPLTGFMDPETLECVLTQHQLPDGTIWPLPIVLQVVPAAHLSAGQSVVLTGGDGSAHSLLDVASVSEVDLDRLAKSWFGTTSRNHPGVDRIYRRGPVVVGGRVTLIQEASDRRSYHQLDPARARLVFAHKGWMRILGFHTRNICHRVHEHIQLEALRRTHADGIYITPVIGPKKPGDFLSEPMMESYHLLIQLGVFPPGKAVLGSFSTYSRYAGPREAVFTALCRKNMGCSHFIVGRDHTGVGTFYAPDANRRLFDRLGDLGIAPVFFEDIGYNTETSTYEPLSSSATVEPISGTKLRQALTRRERLPEWFVRPEIQELLLSKLDHGEEIFVY